MTPGRSPTRNSTDELKRLEAELKWRNRIRAEKELARLQTEKDRRAAEKGRDRLSAFLRAAWHVVEPGRPLNWGWHLDAICEHLEAVAAAQITNLLITIPPGTTKSRTVAVFWPAWVWLRWPESRWLFISNDDGLASRDSMACRRLIESDWFALHYPERPEITTDQNTKTWYENVRAGHRQSMGIRANVTGKKGDVIVVDDANDAEKVESAAERLTINRRWDTAIYDRVIDFKKGRRVVVGQRTHKQDLIGHIIEAGGFEELRIPEEFEPAKRCTTSIGYSDPRTVEGELLRPDQFGPEQVEQAKKRLQSIGYRAKHQQEPMDKEGYRFKRAWLDARRWRYDGDFIVLDDGKGGVQRFLPERQSRWGTADGAASENTAADYTAISAWVTSPRNDLVWVGCRREQLEIPDQPDVLAQEYRKHHMQWVGVESVLANTALFQFAKRTTMVVRKLDPKRQDKLTRATPAIVFAESGRLWLPDRETARRINFPLDAVIAELTAFTGDEDRDEHDDIVDNLSYAVRCQQMGGTGSGGAPGIHKPSGRA